MSRAAQIGIAASAAASFLLWATAGFAQDLCQALADRLRSVPAVAGPDDPWQSPVQVLAALPDPVLHLERGKSLSQSQVLEWLAGQHATPRLLAGVKSLSDFSNKVKLHGFGQSGLQVAIAEEGTADCQNFVFFISSGGKADVTEAPPIVRDRPEGDMICSGFGRYAFPGEMGRQPVLFLEDGRDLHDDIVVTPWRDGSWQRACTIGVDFGAEFAVKLKSCKDLDCPKAAEQARGLIVQYDKDPKVFAQAAAADEKFKLALSGPSELPSFGEPVNSPLNFGEESDVLRVTFDGRAYVARVGHGAIGWRRYPDYLFVLYRVTGNDLEPVAGFQIAKTRSRPTRVIVK